VLQVMDRAKSVVAEWLTVYEASFGLEHDEKV
jgi:hypothetical protein